MSEFTLTLYLIEQSLHTSVAGEMITSLLYLVLAAVTNTSGEDAGSNIYHCPIINLQCLKKQIQMVFIYS